jgi:hypothetical protein
MKRKLDLLDSELMERNKTDISSKTTLRLERSIMSIDGERDKIKISNILKTLPLMDIRSLNKYIVRY